MLAKIKNLWQVIIYILDMNLKKTNITLVKIYYEFCSVSVGRLRSTNVIRPFAKS